MDAFKNTDSALAGPFQHVTQRDTETSRGPVGLPILYKDASLFGAFFLSDLRHARALMSRVETGDGARKRPLEIEPWPLFGKALVALFAWEYRDSTVGRYNEVGLGIQARRRDSSPSLVRLGLDMKAQDDQGIWVVNLPVTTDAAFAAGVEMWGYPKYVTPIETRFDERGASVRLGEELRLSIGELGGPKLRGLPTVTYTEREGRLLRTVIEVDHDVRWGTGRTAKLELLDDGPTSRSLRALGLEGARPSMVFRTDTFRAKLPAGVDLGASRASAG